MLKVYFLMCQEQTGKFPCLSPGNWTLFCILPYFPACPPTHLKITFLKITRIELSVHKVILFGMKFVVCGSI